MPNNLGHILKRNTESPLPRHLSRDCRDEQIFWLHLFVYKMIIKFFFFVSILFLCFCPRIYTFVYINITQKICTIQRVFKSHNNWRTLACFFFQTIYQTNRLQFLKDQVRAVETNLIVIKHKFFAVWLKEHPVLTLSMSTLQLEINWSSMDTLLATV